MGPEPPPSGNPESAPVFIVWGKRSHTSGLPPPPHTHTHFEIGRGAPKLVATNVVGHEHVLEQPVSYPL